jgi:hypothetical protein
MTCAVGDTPPADSPPKWVEIFTTLLRNGTLLYLLAVTPRDCVPEYADTFRRVVGSIEILDCDTCVR